MLKKKHFSIIKTLPKIKALYETLLCNNIITTLFMTCSDGCTTEELEIQSTSLNQPKSPVTE